MSRLRRARPDRRILLRALAMGALATLAPAAAPAARAHAAPPSRADSQASATLAAPALVQASATLAAPALVPALTPSVPQPRVVGGTPTSITKVPWQVSVWSRGGAEGGFDCGGAILDADTVVTAAHCVYGVDIGEDPMEGGLGILAGVSHDMDPIAGDDPQEVVVADARLHPQWNPNEVQTAGDLAVLELDEPLDLSGPAARAVALPPDEPIGDEPALVGQDVLVSGFGRQLANTVPNGGLYSLSTRVETPTVCPGFDNAAALCVRTPAGAACSGDSGGPLVTQTTPPVLVGIVSNGPEGCPAGEAESYVNLATPENRRFLAGALSPPIAPRITGDITFDAAGGLLSVGQPVVCTAGFSGALNTKWKISTDAGRSVATGSGGSSFSYKPTDADVGRTLRCSVNAANDGGVAMAGPIASAGPVLRALGKGDPIRPPVVTPFRLSESLMMASTPRSVKRGKVLTVKVTLTNLFAAADQANVCVKLGSQKPKCAAPAVRGQQGATATLRFRIAKRARVKSLLTLTATTVLSGRNPNTGNVEQVNRSAKVRARVAR